MSAGRVIVVVDAEAHLLDEAERAANAIISDLVAAVAQRFDLPSDAVRTIIEGLAPADRMALEVAEDVVWPFRKELQ